MLLEIIVGFTLVLWILYKLFGPTPSESNGSSKQSRMSQMFGTADIHCIADRFKNLKDLHSALTTAGLESSNLIFGIDFTRSNQTQGSLTFDGRNLHSLSPSGPNPYEQVLRIIGETLCSLDEDGIIPAFGFGDLNTKDHSVFPINPQGHCIGYKQVIDCYRNVAQHVKMSGPTNFSPIIDQAVEIVKQNRMSYHILVIIADGQVVKEAETIHSIVNASNYPLSIIMVGVGDGPWDMMKDFDNKLPQRRFDNFQFVDFHRVMSLSSNQSNPSAAFALAALMEIPDQFIAVRELGLF